MSVLHDLAVLRSHGGMLCTGLDDASIERFASCAPELTQAINDALTRYQDIKAHYPELLALDEQAQIDAIQDGFVNFYASDSVNPYVALSACGSWIVTLKGAVLYDTGGYGMLGFGHTPDAVIQAMAKPQVTANIMTPNLAQYRLIQALKQEIGQTQNGCPYTGFMCLNSGSEAVGLATRIIDAHAKRQTDAGARHAGKIIKRLTIKGSFHGRTDRPALYSNSSRASYDKYLASYKDEDSVITVAPYDIDALKAVFVDADANGWFIEAMLMEPVMGEGNPGRSVPRAFYDAARALTREHGSLLLIDSIQAGLRTTGYLSIVDSPEFEGIEPPDFETYSKAINAGQFPLSILAMTDYASGEYQRGLYGNTMTTNPRALDVACAVLDGMTDDVRANIVHQGKQAIAKLNALQAKLGDAITNVQGTGLLFSCELHPRYKAYGTGSVEEWLRLHGIGVIHGGQNALRFTPQFGISDDELDLVMEKLEQALQAMA
ncbi:aminotransferase class III-fold pyridoxal phosphate-dependent enzyme [Moraxella pluranimalium]|uniref:Lysine 6-aminotransferase n=1 Tax=Moraxella pluranimalium TaxID=470453 RepID=A0A1T0CQI9_9GAMM|nr:aminotransferase class III-fold pyridoxal phosphate-dependent enzyme [Moraxella pluranimalium]OOS24489.1 lysine 6-aminotransferase [Moraxella pluranimalium]